MRTAFVELVRVGPFPTVDHFVRIGDSTLQVCRGTVRVGREAERFALFWPSSEELALGPDARRAAAALEPAGTAAGLVRESTEGSVSVEADPMPESRAFALAAAAAAMRVSWAWDDSAVIAVSVNEGQFAFATEFTGGAWQVVEIATGGLTVAKADKASLLKRAARAIMRQALHLNSRR